MKLVEKIARVAHTKERKLVFEESPINCSWEKLPSGFRNLYLQDATTLLQAILSDPNIIEIDPDAELPRYLCDPSVSIAENIRRFKGILKEAGWVKKK